MPDGQTHVTTPGSALLFPSLCAPTGEVSAVDAARLDRRGDRTAMMPLRTTTRPQNRAQGINTERNHNRQARLATQPAPPDDEEPPPF